MSNAVKTAFLLGALSALLLFLGETLGGGQGLVVAFFFAVATNFASIIRSSAVKKLAPWTRAVATRMRSAGSPWNQEGSDATSAATAGVNSLNLRNLGSNRTLVLVDGQR